MARVERRDAHRVSTLRVSRALRRAILAAAESPGLQRVVRRYGMRLGASRFVAGETLDQAVAVLRRLNDQGLRANTTLLGEGVVNESRDSRGRRCLPGDPRSHRGRAAARERRA